MAEIWRSRDDPFQTTLEARHPVPPGLSAERRQQRALRWRRVISMHYTSAATADKMIDPLISEIEKCWDETQEYGSAFFQYHFELAAPDMCADARCRKSRAERNFWAVRQVWPVPGWHPEQPNYEIEAVIFAVFNIQPWLDLIKRYGNDIHTNSQDGWQWFCNKYLNGNAYSPKNTNDRNTENGWRKRHIHYLHKYAEQRRYSGTTDSANPPAIPQAPAGGAPRAGPSARGRPAPTTGELVEEGMRRLRTRGS